MTGKGLRSICRLKKSRSTHCRQQRPGQFLLPVDSPSGAHSDRSEIKDTTITAPKSRYQITPPDTSASKIATVRKDIS